MFDFDKGKKYSCQEILAFNLGVSHATIKKWLKQYREESLSSYLSIKRGGNRASVISIDIHNALYERVNNSNDPFRGYWDVQLWIKENFNTDIKYSTHRYYLIRHLKQN